MVCGRGAVLLQAAILVITVSGSTMWKVSGLGSMSSIAVSYGENGPVFCGLSVEATHQVTCYGADASIVYGAPSRLPFLGLTAGDGFVCGLLMDTRQPYCWGNNVYVNMGVPQPMPEGASYSEISAGDHHLCGVRRPGENNASSFFVDCWGYNMTAAHAFPWSVRALTAGSAFNCALSVPNRTVACWGDETGSGIFASAPRDTKFRTISAGGFHVCGVREDYRVGCWGKSLSMERVSPESLGEGDVDLTPVDPMVAVVGGRFHACGIRWVDRSVVCWGFRLTNSVPPPEGTKVYQIAAGDYFTCGVLAERSLKPVCWGTGFPTSIPMAVSPGICVSSPCGPGFYEFTREKIELCKSPPDSRVCLPCSNNGCPDGTYQFTSCNSKSDRRCEFNCSSSGACATPECSAFCSSSKNSTLHRRPPISMQLPMVVAELVFAVVLVSAVSLAAWLYVRYRLRRCTCSATDQAKDPKEAAQVMKVLRPDLEELRIRRARMFSYEELEKATGGFSEESQVGRGSFSCVFKGVLRDGTVVAVKRAAIAADLKKNSKEFRTELDLLSRLNHAHLLNLLGYCEEAGERLLVYEFMAHGSLHQHLHRDPTQREQLDWVRRVTIAVQAARGIEYLHGYACPPVIHRDIKSSNILIDEEHNARVADFGLSLLGPADSSSPLSELPAGTLGYLDPEYYRLHYLTTKSDVYSFGVLLLEILSGRKAIDMQYEEGSNIVEWAVPLIKSGDVAGVLDPVLKPPAEIEALRRIALTACKCVRMRGKERPSMDKVTTALERALALLMGSPCNDQPILPTEVVLGSSRLHKKAASQRSTSNPSCSENDMAESSEVDQRFEFRAPSWITFPSVTSSQRRKSSVSEADADLKNTDGRNHGSNSTAAAAAGDGLRCLEEEIGPASPQEDLFLQHVRMSC